MAKTSIAIFFTVLFMALIVTPTVIVALDNTFDTSIFYSMAEEEENGKQKNVLSPFSLQNNDMTTNFELKNLLAFSYQFKKYAKPHLNLVSPPPEPHIL
ncbi:MAG: hypothetical protein ACK5MZ_04260 [Aestuariibaculum sp.]